nr:T9SS type A sorting domain-containing protein [Bacteroidota bacterium]
TPMPDLGENNAANGGFNRFINNDYGEFQLYYYGTYPLIAFLNDWGYYTLDDIEEHIYDDDEAGTTGQVVFNPWFDPSDLAWELNADFEVDFTKIHVGGLLHFTDLSTGNPNPSRWEWDFMSDGNVETEAQNPTYAYSSEGIYTVTMVVSNGAFETVIVKEDYINVGNFGAPDITAITDVPNDQGGWVYANFTKSEFDTNSLVRSTEYYSVQINAGNGWFSAGYSSAYGADSYSVICHTPYDSTAYSPGLLDFRVIAAMDEGTYVSDEVVGYSVDNLKPSVPTGIDAILGDTLIILTWDPCPDADFDYFSIYRSEQENVFPDEPYAWTIETTWSDLIGVEDFYYYKITAVDFNGNESDGSGVISTYKFIDLTIPQGWSGFSTWLNPMDENIENMFNPILSELVILQNQSGMYWPGQSVNTLGTWDILSGYAIKLVDQVEMTITSTREVFRSVDLPEGWCLIPVLSDNSVNVAELFLDADVKIVKDVAGSGVYWPELNINSLISVDPGRAYFVKSNSAGSIIYPILSEKSTATIGRSDEFRNITPWNDVIFTSGSHIVAITGNALSTLEPGDVIGAFTTSGLCAGMAEYLNGEFALSLNTDDAYTSLPDGFGDNEDISFRLFRSSINEVCDLEVVFDPSLDNSGKFHADGLSAITQLKISGAGVNAFQNEVISIYPNPTSGEFIIEGVRSLSQVEFSTVAGEQISSHQISNDKTFDLGDLPKGLYLVKITNENGTIIRKLVLR